MNFSGLFVLAYIEEDNIDKSFFRVRPYMTQNGIVPEEELSIYGDEGFLRVVPDKHEKHTFKDRMRSLGELCVLNLHDFKAESAKIKQNKNYCPERGEKNQNIVYSDAVQSIRKDLFYEVVTQGEGKNALTPLVYIRNGANISGPVNKDTEEKNGEQVQIRPDSPFLHTLTLKNESEHLIYWPVMPANEKTDNTVRSVTFPEVTKENDGHEAAEANGKHDLLVKGEEQSKVDVKTDVVGENVNNGIVADTQEKKTETIDAESDGKSSSVEDTANPMKAEHKEETVEAYQKIQNISDSSRPQKNLLRDPKNADIPYPVQLQRPAKLSGTPLYQPGLRQATPVRNHNMLSETVERQRYASRYEAAGAEISADTRLKSIDNPVEAFGTALDKAWQSKDTQERIAEIILQNDSLRQALNRKMNSAYGDLTVAAVHEQLQDMEAERLMQLMRLDELKNNRDEMYAEALKSREKENEKLLCRGNTALQELNAQLADMTSEQQKLIKVRDELVADIEKTDAGYYILSRSNGDTLSLNQVFALVYEAFEKSGFSITENQAIALVIVKLLFNSFTVCSRHYSDAVFAMNTFSDALGAVSVNTDECDPWIISGGNSFLFTYGETACENGDHIFTCELGPDKHVLPVINFSQNADKLPEKVKMGIPINEKALVQEAMQDIPELPEAIRKLIIATRKAMPVPMPAEDTLHMISFIRCASRYMKGGIAAATDTAWQIFILPYMKQNHYDLKSIKELSTGLPGTSAQIS